MKIEVDSIDHGIGNNEKARGIMNIFEQKNYDAILLDLDDTILDFGASEVYALEKLYQDYFAHTKDKEGFIETFHRINKALWQQVHTEGLKPSVLKTMRFELLSTEYRTDCDIHLIREYYESKLSETIFWLEGAQRTLHELRKSCKMGVITNGLTTVQKRKYDLMKGHEFFECFLISEEVGIAKPHYQIFEMALEGLGVDRERTLMVGDSLESDYQGAINAGMDFCWVKKEKEELLPVYKEPHYTVKGIVELLDLLRSKTLA